jgi:hypothetical protein
MNTKELIFELEERHLQGCIYEEAATMLHQQQAEIEALKAENQFFKDIMGDVEILRKAQEK